MKIRILSPCYVAGKAYKKGDVIDVAEKETRDVIGLKRAEKFVEKEAAKTTGDPDGGKEAGGKGKKEKGGDA